MNRYVTKAKPHIYIPAPYQRILWNQTLRGGAEYNERHNGEGLRFTDYFNVVRPKPIPGADREQQRFSVGGISIRTFRTRHYPEQATSWSDAMYSIGYVVDERVVISGDTQFDSDLLETVSPKGGAEAIFQDTQFFPGGIHASLDEVATLPAPLKKKTHLIHYGDNYEEKRSIVADYGFAGFAQEGVIYEF